MGMALCPPCFGRCLALFFLPVKAVKGALPEELLASVDEEAPATYLMESDLTTEELLDMASLDEADINALNGQLLPGLDADALEKYVVKRIIKNTNRMKNIIKYCL